MLDEVPLVGPLALNEGKPVADGALIADEEQAAGTFGVGVEFVALVFVSVVLSRWQRRIRNVSMAHMVA